MNLQIAVLFTDKISENVIEPQDVNLIEYLAPNKLKNLKTNTNHIK